MKRIKEYKKGLSDIISEARQIIMNDNRNYQYGPNSVSERKEYPIIFDWIPKRSSVIDLGCGDGTLLQMLIHKEVETCGMDVSETAVRVAQKKGLKVRQGRIDHKLAYKNKFFDYAICSSTLQMVMYPEILLSEMVRVSKKQIISFPNFAFILNRLELLVKGRMPKFMLYGYDWYSTGHIHQLSISDFTDYCQDESVKILDVKYYSFGGYTSLFSPLAGLFPNTLALSGLFLTEKHI